MRTVTVYRHGLVLGTSNASNHERAPRGKVGGWSSAAARRNTQFLYAVDERHLTGHGYAITLTVKNCPTSPAEWKRYREALFKRYQRLGLISLHWVTEWQRRGVPHLHLAAYFREPQTVNTLALPWVQSTLHLGTLPRGQHVAPIADSVGWLKYLAKHAARGVSHYQRSSGCIPASWEGVTGRVWGHLGEWPSKEPVKLHLDHKGWCKLRRFSRSWRIAHHLGNPQRQRHARRCLRRPDRVASSLVSVNEWIPSAVSVRMIEWLASEGHALSKRDSD